ncbi:MAG: hypothetical protein J3K34DRAFT_98812 [Monoraphidium minutum]|nr:MAG: hypothetical protein J3K34DRAFT_98812 [Monoraphidium minutum]
MSRLIVALVLVGLVAAAAADKAAAKYSCKPPKGYVDKDGKALKVATWTMTLLDADGKKSGTVTLCLDKQRASAADTLDYSGGRRLLQALPPCNATANVTTNCTTPVVPLPPCNATLNITTNCTTPPPPPTVNITGLQYKFAIKNLNNYAAIEITGPLNLSSVLFPLGGPTGFTKALSGNGVIPASVLPTGFLLAACPSNGDSGDTALKSRIKLTTGANNAESTVTIKGNCDLGTKKTK